MKAKRQVLIWILLAVVGLCVVAVGIAPVRRHLASTARAVRSISKAVLDRSRVRADSRGNYTNVVFLHHSVGHNLIRQGRLRERLRQAGFDLYDQDYNNLGLFRPDGTPAGYGYNVPGDNTNPEGLLRVFKQKRYGLPWNTLSGFFQHEVIVLKSCYIAVQYLTAADTEAQKSSYRQIRDHLARHPDKLFVILTSPPANPAETDAYSASQARVLADWLQSEEFQAGTVNLYVFDLFAFFAENNPDSPGYNMLRREFRWGQDSHPNQLANESLSPVLADFIVKSVESFRKRK